MFSQATALLGLAASASAHIVMTFPVPYSQATLNNSPLQASDFPCKQRPNMYQVTQMNQWNAGETKPVKFMGSAVHGGGSCQFSITTDAAPTKDSQWKVIQSNIGGCPANVGDKNLDSGSPDDKSGPSFPVTMPKDIPAGQYTFAWSWINKIGNREFYMNCAPIQVGGSSNTASTASAAQAMSALPDMFVANLPDTGCSTPAMVDFEYPNPGKNVVKVSNAVTAGSKATGGQCQAQADMGRGKGQIGSPSAGTPAQSGTPSQPQVSSKPSASAPSYQAPAQSSAAANPGFPGGVFAPGASSAPASKPTAQPAPPAAQPVPSAKPQPPKDAPNNTTPVSGSGDCTPCTNDGGVVCIGSKQFGLCNRGCAVAQDLAAGMACTNGVVVAATKRHLHFPRAHLHRRLSAARLL